MQRLMQFTLGTDKCPPELPQDPVLRVCEIGWQLTTLGHVTVLCMQAGTEKFHPLFHLSTSEVELEQNRITNITDDDHRKFQEKYLLGVLKKRDDYMWTYNNTRGKKNGTQFLKDFVAGGKSIKALVGVYAVLLTAADRVGHFDCWDEVMEDQSELGMFGLSNLAWHQTLWKLPSSANCCRECSFRAKI